MSEVRTSDIHNILAIRFMRLGDVILMLPALARLKSHYRSARLTLVTDERCAAVARMCPFIDEVMSVDRLAMRDGPVFPALKAMARLAAEIRRRRFDLVIDFLSFRETNLLAWISGARYRLGMKRWKRAYLSCCFNMPPVPEDKALHVADMFQAVVDGAMNGSTPVRAVQQAAPPVLVLPESARRWAEEAAPARPTIAMYVGAPVAVRRWPAENFARVADFVVERLGASVMVLAGAPDAEIAERVRRAAFRAERVSIFYEATIPQLAALIARSQLLVSNDTGPMHLGPALGVPTLGIFSVGYPEHFRPLGERSRYVRANPIENVSAEAVMRQVEEMRNW